MGKITSKFILTRLITNQADPLIFSRNADCQQVLKLQLGVGFLESVYKNALIFELNNNGINDIESEVSINVYYNDIIVGEFRADIIVNKQIIIELKSVLNLTVAHETQLVNYLTATKIDHGLLINLGSEQLKIKRKFRKYKQTNP